MTESNLGEQLIVVICPPRSGSTMLLHMLESHSAIQGLPEPHLLPPLQYLGYYDQPGRAKYDVVNCSLALREFVGHLPRGEEDYLDALRAYALCLYDRARSIGGPGKHYFVDKTPINALHWRFVTKLFPRAKYVVLSRHPVAILDSVARTFYAGDYARLFADDNTPAVYIKEIAAFIRQANVDMIHIGYEQLLKHPEAQCEELLEFLGLAMESAVVQYGQAEHVKGCMGDPLTVHTRTAPDAALADRWIDHMGASQTHRQFAEQFVRQLSADDVRTFGYDSATLLPSANCDRSMARPKFNRIGGLRFRIMRRVYFILRRFMHWRGVRRALERLRYYCDVLLRE